MGSLCFALQRFWHDSLHQKDSNHSFPQCASLSCVKGSPPPSEQPMKAILTLLAACTLTLFTLTLPTMSVAQSTLADPVPIQGDQGRSIAANAAMGSAAMQGGIKTSPEEFARRKQHVAEATACRERYRASTRSGSPERASARKACESQLAAKRATWYAKK
jgi:hypothetical protein